MQGETKNAEKEHSFEGQIKGGWSGVYAHLSINCKTKSSNSAVAEQSSRSTYNMLM